MTIEDRVRRVLTEAVADEPPPRGAPLQAAIRRRRRRPVLVGAAALLLVLAAVVSVVAVRDRNGTRPVTPVDTTAPPTTAPPTTVVSTAAWKTFTDADHNLRLRYPPDWVVRRRNAEGTVTLAPREHAGKALARWPSAAVTVTAGGSYYLGEAPEPGFTRGRLPGGQAYLYFQSDPAQVPQVQAPGEPPVPANVADRRRMGSYSIDWGRDCKGIRPYRCGPHGVHVTIYAGNTSLWDRYLPVAEAIIRSARPVTPTRPSYGDRSLPPCRPGQWEMVWTGEHGFAGPRFFLSGGVRHLGGPRCHLRARLSLRVEQDGRRLPVPGNPASRVLEGDLPGDGITEEGGSLVMRGGPLFWSFYWDEWCNKGLEGPTRLFLTSTGNGQELRIAGPGSGPSAGSQRCQDRGRPSRLAAWQ
ncbi:MAG TPA: hypothetical protein VHS79_07910 [Actinomycetes bacterium]|jgi:hypothetical protein|nr:hypothetical protein [Actinomycetes bacterium]